MLDRNGGREELEGVGERGNSTQNILYGVILFSIKENIKWDISSSKGSEVFMSFENLP